MKQFYLITQRKELEKLLGITNGEIWEKGVDLDDWDYFIAVKTNDKQNKSSDMRFNPIPKDEIWERLLNGGCDNSWYHVETKNGNFYIGGAYHS